MTLALPVADFLAEHEEILFCSEPDVGLRAVVAIHSTVLGPALGGCRFYPFPSEAAAVADVLRLSAGMTMKNALAGLDIGGGKAVVIGDPSRQRSEPLLRAFGRFVESLGGRYITAPDVGTTSDDMDVVGLETGYVAGRSPARGGSGDVSRSTALGVEMAMRAVARHRWGAESLAGRSIAIAGLGKVGSLLARRLAEAGAVLTVADTDAAAVARVVEATGAATASPEHIHRTRCDFFSPNALGGVLSAATIGELGCGAVVGAANNQLVDQSCAGRLAEAGIVYVPDYVANAGGVIQCAGEFDGSSAAQVEARVRGICDTTRMILERAETDGVTTAAAADALARARIDGARRRPEETT